jgi:hypothetical protein
MFASIVAWGRQQESMRGQRAVTWIVGAAVGASIWGAVGSFVLFWIVLGQSGCLS